jgi:ABC-2 type transport system permease protein/sodium transport system permease protein
MNETPASPPVPRALSQFSLSRQWRLTKKEWAETLRDRRTIITLVLMPILVYPLLSMVFHQFVFSSLGKHGQLRILIGIRDGETRERLETSLKVGDMWLTHQSEADFPGEQIEPPLVEEPAVEQLSFLVGEIDLLLKAQRVDLAVSIREDAEQRPHWQIHFVERSPVSLAVRSFIERRLRAANAAVRFQRKEVNTAIPLEYHAVPAVGGSRSLLPSIVPLVLLMMTITGAVYPAIDVTAGERERGTLEALIAAPVSRLGLLLAKYVAVLTVALLTAGVNLIAMTSTIFGTGLSEVLFGFGGISVMLLVQIFGLLLLFASFFSAVLLAVTSFARSFKEAQAYLIPLMLLTLGPGLMSLSPTLQLTELMALVPLMNVVLLARDVFSGAADPLTAGLTVFSTLTYAAISIAIAARIFGSDAILYGSANSWSSLWSKSSVAPVAASLSPSTTAAGFVMVLCLALQLNLGGVAQFIAQPYGMPMQLLAAAGATLLIFWGLPLCFALAERVNLSSGFRLHSSTMLSWCAALVIGLSSGLLVMELTLLGKQFGLLAVREALAKLLMQRVAEFQTVPIAWLLFTMAVIPACAEELCFRGYLFQAWRTRYGVRAALILTTLGFAACHIFSGSGFVFERLLPSLLMGGLLGLVAWRTGSVLPGMLLHSLNNALLLSLARYRETLTTQGWLNGSSEHLPSSWLIAAGVMTLLGMVLLFYTAQSKSRD